MIPLRLLAVTAFIKADDVVADIGSDHGYLALHLAKRGHNYVYASENKLGPYRRLKNSTNEARDIIEVTLSDGLEHLPAKVNTLVIAGMGGSLIVDILKKHPEKLANIKKILLAPQGSEGEVRQTLAALNYQLINEKIVKENNHYYEIIVAEPGVCTLNELEVIFGPINLKEKSREFRQKWQRIYEINDNICQNPNITMLKREALNKEQSLIRSVLKE